VVWIGGAGSEAGDAECHPLRFVFSRARGLDGTGVKAAAVFPVGQTEGGCVAGIREILRREAPLAEPLRVYLLHGVLAVGQAPPAPGEVARRVASTDFGHAVEYPLIAPVDSFDLEAAYATAREAMGQIAAARYDRVYVGITGGANPLVASVFHTAVTYLEAEVVPIYAQGRGLATQRTFVAADLRLGVLAERVMEAARRGQMRLAAQLAERLPNEGKWGFLRAGTEALAAWDDFDYPAARDIVRRQERHCAAYGTDRLVSPLADVVRRLAAVADRMVRIMETFRNEPGFEKAVSAADWPAHARKDGGLLVADVMANARRRLAEGRYTDSVLRAYRGAECATQVRLYEACLHPGRPNACRRAFEQAREHLKDEGPIAFRAGLYLLRDVSGLSCEAIERNVQDLGQTRNKTFLEHGYTRVRRDQAERCLEHAMAICRHILGEDEVRAWPDLDIRPLEMGARGAVI
jgi:hypothetical protein